MRTKMLSMDQAYHFKQLLYLTNESLQKCLQKYICWLFANYFSSEGN